ncbi:MAG: glycosyltransferase family 2 protein [Bacteroidales bacterium]|nr:glycosyltransferase family 2 protein [Bacteroidales bacterium]
MKKISATIIAFNEERNIERCLQSLQGVADEIIVVDSLSKDKTVEICEKYKTKVFQHPFEGYGSQKNFAVSQASFDLILSLDADEALSEELKKSLLAARENEAFDAYKCNRINNFCGKWIKHGGWYPDRQLRFWNRNAGNWNDSKVHERVVLKPDAKLGHLKGDLLHYSYYSFDEYVQQMNKYSDLKAEEMIRRGKKANLFKMFFKPFGKFLTNCFFKVGFLDGYYGIVLAISAGYADFITQVKMKEKSGRKS